MERTTVFLERRQLRAAKLLARKRGKSFAQVVRDALGAYMVGERSPRSRLPRLAGRYSSGRSDVSCRVAESPPR